MQGTYVDDRSEEERATHTVIVSGIDPGMSGWGKAEKGTSVAGWACRPEDVDAVFSWVKARGDLRRVRVEAHALRKGRVAHTHVYCVRANHPSVTR